MLKLIDGDVRGQVVHREQRLAQGQGVRLGGADTYQQRPGEPRPGRDGDRVHVGQGDPCGGQRAVHGGNHGLQVRPARHLGDHATEPRVLSHAGGDRVGEKLVAADQASACLVAGSLDTKDQWRGHPLPSVRCRARRTHAFGVAGAEEAWAPADPGAFAAVRRMTSASVPDGW